MLTIDDITVGEELLPLRHDVTASTVVLGALASRDWRPMHHDHLFAVERNGTRDIFLNTPTQAGWFARYVTDWAGPRARIGRMSFKMINSVFPGDLMSITGTVREVTTDDAGCGWADLSIVLSVDGTVCTSCELRVAIPRSVGDNPWTRTGADWQPEEDLTDGS